MSRNAVKQPHYLLLELPDFKLLYHYLLVVLLDLPGQLHYPLFVVIWVERGGCRLVSLLLVFASQHKGCGAAAVGLGSGAGTQSALMIGAGGG